MLKEFLLPNSAAARRTLLSIVLVSWLSGTAAGQKVLTWTQVRNQFEAANLNLRAGQIGVNENRANEITAHMRPNPVGIAVLDQISALTSYSSRTGANVYRPFGFALPFYYTGYLIERQHKRDLRYESAQGATAIAQWMQRDMERNLLFEVRAAFIQILQAKATLNVNRESLTFYDHVLQLADARLKAGDIAQVDLARLQLRRIQFLTDVQTSIVSLRTAKIQLLALLNDRTPVDQFDVTGEFDFHELPLTLDELRRIALASRPDLQGAGRAIDKAKTDHRLAMANGSTDPIVGMDFARNPPLPVYFGFNVSFPLRIFDRNQGEKARTQMEISRSEKVRDATAVQVYSDVDSAYAILNSNLTLLRPYKTTYLQQAVTVRETISFAYQRGGASLLDFLIAENDYRSIQLGYLSLVGAYLMSANQLNLAVGREVIP